MKNLTPLYRLRYITIICLLFCSCSHHTDNQITQIGENTFTRKDKIYRIVDNEVSEIGDLAKPTRKFEITKPVETSYGESSLSYVKEYAYAKLSALYRGNTLYFKLGIYEFNDLRENYAPGMFIVEFMDSYGYILHSTEIPVSELTRVMNADKTVNHFEYSGKTEMSSEINKAIESYSVAASIKRKTSSYY